MKFLTAFILLFLLFSCNGGGGKSIKLSELDQSLAVYENKEGLDGIKKSVTYSVTGKKNYDEIFKESAKTAAVLKQLNFALEQANKNPEETFDKLNQTLLKLDINPKKIKSISDLVKEIDKKATPKDKENLFLIYNLDFGIKKVPEIIKSSKKMKDDVTKLNPKNDFKGTDAMKIPNAVSGVSTTLTNIETSVKGLPKILKNSKSLTGNLITYLQSGTFDKNAVVQNDDTEETVETESIETDSENNKTDQTKTAISENKEVKVIISVIPNSDVSQNTVNIFKSGMENSLALKNYVVIPSELETNQCSSNDINCFIKIAKFSKADEIILVETQKIENKYMFKLKTINVEKNGISKSTSKFYDGDVSNFDYLLTFAENLTNNMLGTVSIASENNKIEKTEKEINIIKCTDSCKLDISSDIDSKIFINTIHKGNQQISTTLKAGTYNIKVTKDGYEDFEEELIIDKDTNKTIVLKRNIFNFKISSNIDADVYINDELKGKTPFETTLKKGIYKLTLKKEGYEDFEFEGKVEKDIDKEFNLIQNLFNIEINSNVDADVYIDDELRGKTPLNLTLKRGDYSIMLKKGGYESFKSNFSIVDKDEYSNVNLLKLFNLNIVSNIEADVYINDELQKNKTPFDIKLKKGIYNVKIFKNGYDPYEEEIIIENEDISKNITLKNYYFGIKAGFGTSSYNWFNGISYNYNVGGLFKYNLGILKLQTELLFVSKNKNYKDINLSQLSIDLPLIFGVNIGNKSLYTGFYVSETFFVKMDKGTELKNDGLVANLGWLVGFDVKISNFLIDLRFSKDYSSIIDIDGKNLLNELFSLNFGYLF